MTSPPLHLGVTVQSASPHRRPVSTGEGSPAGPALCGGTLSGWDEDPPDGVGGDGAGGADGAAGAALEPLRAAALLLGALAVPAGTAVPAGSVPARAGHRAGGAAPRWLLRRTARHGRRHGAQPVDYTPPVDGALRVLRGFDLMLLPLRRGHRGVDLAAPGGRVLAAAAGTVTFAGPVAGRGVVVLEHRDGIRTEYEPVRPSVRVGAVVGRGTPLGEVAGRHPGCVPADCLHWGARRGDTYLDPLLLLRPLGPVRLLPGP